MYDRILVPTDGSDGTAETMEHALHLAADNDATVHVLHVVDRRMYLAADDDTKEDVIASLKSEGEAALADARDRAEAAGVAVETELREDIPHRGILACAEERDVDLIAMGTHGRTGRDRMANLGSVTDRVVENAEVPVLVVQIGGG